MNSLRRLLYYETLYVGKKRQSFEYKVIIESMYYEALCVKKKCIWISRQFFEYKVIKDSNSNNCGTIV